MREFQLGITGAHHGKGVVIVAEPDVQSVFLDASGGAASGGALAAEAPPLLIDRDLKATLVLRRRQLESGGQGATAAADDRHFEGRFLSVARHRSAVGLR